MGKDNTLECIDSPVSELVELFRGPLAEVTFPNMDVGVLNAGVDRVRARNEEVERLRQALDAARDALEAERRALRDQARQAHAYAKVYATGNDELDASLDAIVLDPPKRAPRKPRVKRAKATAPQLVLDNDKPKRVAAS